MIASLRGVIALAIVALGLGLAAALWTTTTGDTGLVDRSIVPGFDAANTYQLTWTRPRGGDVTVVRRDASNWQMRKPHLRCDPRAVETVLATLRGARWHRRGDRDRAGTIHATLTAGRHVIELGDPIHGADQTWIVADGAAMLVDGWVARALDPDPLALRDREPFAVAFGTDLFVKRNGVTVVELHGRPWRDPHGLVAPEILDGLMRALERVTLVRAPDPAGATIDIATATVISGAGPVFEIAVGGPCPGDPHFVALASDAHDIDGCIDPALWHDVEGAIARFAAPAQDLLDRRPAAGDVVAIKLPDGVVDLSKRATVRIENVDRAADPGRVAELVAALATPAELVPLPALAASGQLRVELRDGSSIGLLRYGNLLARPGEAFALRLPPALVATIARPIQSYVDPTRWLEEPSTITAITIDGRVVRRGAVIGEWLDGTATLPASDAALVDALATAVAQVRAPLADVPATFRPQQTLTVAFVPPVGAPSTHVLELGALDATGCVARLDHIGGRAPLALCTAARSLLSHHP